jgi:hypothetical protein
MVNVVYNNCSSKTFTKKTDKKKLKEDILDIYNKDNDKFKSNLDNIKSTLENQYLRRTELYTIHFNFKLKEGTIYINFYNKDTPRGKVKKRLKNKMDSI